MKRINNYFLLILNCLIITFLFTGCGIVSNTNDSNEVTMNCTVEVTESVVHIQDDLTTEEDGDYENCAPGNSPPNVTGEQYERIWKSDDGSIEFVCNNSRGIYGHGRYAGKYHNNGETYNVEVDITGGKNGYFGVDIPVMIDSTTQSIRPIMVGFYVYENDTLVVTTKEPDIDGLPPVYDDVSKYTFGETVTFHRE